MNCKYLFFIVDNKIKTYHYRNGNFQLVKCKGSESFDEDKELFWNWWEEKSAYIEGEAKVDFCFLSDINDYISSNKYTPVEISTWNISEIEDFLNQNTLYNKLCMLKNGVEKEVNIKKENKNYMNLKSQKLYLECFPKIKSIDVKIKKTENEVKESLLSKYYKAKTKEIKLKK